MKKILFSFLILLIGCQSTPSSSVIYTLSPSPQAGIVESVPASISTFQFNEQCPHGCWMGISPGISTLQDAKTVLSASDRIDPKWLQVSDTGISAIWYPDPIDSLPAHVPVHVGITFEDGLVKTISLGPLPFRLKDLTNLIGEPDKISVTLMKGAEREFIAYGVYFSIQKIRIDVDLGEWTGPDPRDYISGLFLNTEFNIASWQGIIQPWLGYGHIKDYLPGVEIPLYDLTPSP